MLEAADLAVLAEEVEAIVGEDQRTLAHAAVLPGDLARIELQRGEDRAIEPVQVIADQDRRGIALVDEASAMGVMSRMAQATRAALAAVGPPPPFDPLARFMAHLEVEYGGFRRDQMQRIQDFRREKEDTPRTMYTRLARLAAEAGDVFTERQLVKIFISKLDKQVVDLITSRLFFDYHCNASLA